jgi:arginase family enzyme
MGSGMAGIALENSIKFFGASLDALDHQEAVDLKRSYIQALALGKCPQPDLRDPYALFRNIASDRIKESGHQNLGRFIIESWLTPKPQMSDIDLIDGKCYQQFIREDGFKVFAELLKEFVQAHIFPSIPGMIGVDHSLTGGVLMALSERMGCENLGIIVFDVHTDAIPLPIRSGLVQYALEAGLPSPSEISNSKTFDPYATGNFLLHLIEDEIILPTNLILVGPGDDADKWRKSKDNRVMEYVRHYDSLMERGVKIISRDQLKKWGPTAVQNELDQLKCSHLYISLDVDVSAQCGVLAARFIDLIGTETTLVLETVWRVAGLLSSKRFELAGLDVMEIDIHRVGMELEDGLKDQTENFIQKFIASLAYNLPSPSSEMWT